MPSANFHQKIDVESNSFYLFSRYHIYVRKMSFYAKAAIGYTDHVVGQDFESLNNSMMTDFGVGTSHIIRGSDRVFVEFSHYSTNAKGSAYNDNEFALSNTNFDVGFQKFVFKIGYSIGLRRF